jgi:hypothetical protein
MSGHAEGTLDSQALCIALFVALKKRIPDVQRSESQRWCGLFRLHHSRFAYVQHYKASGRIQVWCRGPAAEWNNESVVSYVERSPTDSGWGDTFQGRFELTSTENVDAAAETLYRLAYSGS